MPTRLKILISTLLLVVAATIAHAQGIGGAHNTISVTTRDSSIIESSLFTPVDSTQQRFPVVILLHMLGHDRTTYYDLVPQLLDRDWAVLAMDLRGHGKSQFVRKRFRTIKELSYGDYQLMVGDLSLTLAKIAEKYPRIDTAQLAVVGASIGSTIGTKFAARSPNTRALVLLSPGLKYKRIPVDGPLADYRKRPVLILVGTQDDYSYASAVQLKDVANGPVRLEEYDMDNHGTELLGEKLGADSLIVNWLGTYLE